MIMSEADLRRWGTTIGGDIPTPAFLCLRGELGAGKSVLARAVAHGAGVVGTLPSPTFNLLFRYEGTDGIEVVHMDLYRLTEAEEVWELGWEELGAGDQIVLVEWPERAEEFLPADRWEVALLPVPQRPVLRRVEVTRVGDPPELPPFPFTVDAGGKAR